MAYDVSEYSDYEYEKYVYFNGREPGDGYMDDKYGRGQWTEFDSSQRRERYCNGRDDERETDA